MNLAQTELSHLHAATCLAITQFSSSGRRCACLANRIVLLLQYLVTQPDLSLTTTSRDLYLNLLDHWQQVLNELKLKEPEPATFYH